MSEFPLSLSRMAGLFALNLAGYFALGYGGIVIWADPHSLSPIWPATALGLVLMLRLSRNTGEDIAMLAAMLVAGFAANRLGGGSFRVSLIFSLINIVDVCAAVFAMRRIGTLPRVSSTVAAVRFFIVAGLAPSLLGALLAAGVMVVLGHSGTAALSGLRWFAANLLGVMIILPFGMTISLRQFAKLKLKHRFVEALLLFSAIAAVSVLGFRYGAPVLFLVLVGVLAAGVRFRLLGVGAALLVIAAIAFAAAHGRGANHDLAWVETLQFYLATCSVVGIRTALLLNERDLHLAIIERRHRRSVRAGRFKSQLLAHVSHEVRSPLSAIIGFSSMLEKGTLSADRAPEFAAIIAHNGELLQRLHDDLLDMGRADAGALTFRAERVAVQSTLAACIGAIRLDASLGGKSVVMENVDSALELRADPLRLAQILNNLIANAFKYGDNHSPIRVKAHALDDGFGRIEIVNAGPGIPAGERAAVFAPFRRSSQVGRHVPGAGLGLSIAKLLVEGQGGRIDFHSEPGRQTRFWIDLPLAA